MLYYTNESYKNRESLNSLIINNDKNSKVLNNIGYAYYCGEFDYELDLAKALEYFNKAAELGDGAALFNLGLYYYEGKDGAEDIGKCKEYMEKSKAAGNAYAAEMLGSIYESENNRKNAVQNYLQAIEVGNQLNDDTLNRVLARSLALLKGHDLNKARIVAEKALDILKWRTSSNNEHSESVKMAKDFLGKFHYDNGDYELACKYDYFPAFGKKLVQDGDDLFYGLKNGEIDVKNWNYEEARNLYEKAAAEPHSLQEAQDKLDEIKLYRKNGEWESRNSLRRKLESFLPSIFDYYAHLVSDNYYSISQDAYYLNSDVYRRKLLTRATASLQIEIEISDEQPTHSYSGNISKEKVLEILRKYLTIYEERLVEITNAPSDMLSYLREKLERIVMLLKQLIKALKECGIDQRIISEYATEVKNELGQCDFRLPRDLKKALFILIKGDFTYLVLSTYDNDKKTIIIYINNIKKVVDSTWSLEKSIMGALVHAAFYAYHSVFTNLIGNKYSVDSSYNNIIVIESLAEYGEYCYCSDVLFKCDDSNSILRGAFTDEWETNPIEVWPFTGAKYLVDVPSYNSSNKHFIFQDVFFCSLFSLRDAFDRIQASIIVLDGFGKHIAC